ncbi:hypothetical protein D9619_011456 [Psilocybe cf. subviscida]|uniref:F-box domain-containing protein n=1 Tax=Psilocybe cf. subviscida TaxID=2480587 RepID=A0A8H5FA72_9AGAR|nr:hypothetical protein D9619_011456 [Psilocybe cf. subviscida]
MNTPNPSPHFISSEDQITVKDSGWTGSPSPQPLFQYLATDVSTQLINSGRPRTCAALDAELASVTAIIEGLQVLQVFKRKLRNRCMPILTLPPEILSQIFIAGFNDYATYDFEEPRSTALPLDFGQVCTFWRTVLQNTPQLWNVVHCHVWKPENSHIQAAVLLQWLNRSKSLPLTLKISFKNEDDWISRSSPSAIIDTFLQFSDRWQNVNIILPISWYGRLRLAPFSSLEVLHLRPPGPVKYFGKMLRGFSRAPKLAIISYDTFFLRYLDLPWMNLTSATIGGPSIDEALEFVARCPDLTCLHLIDPTVDQGTFPVALRTHFFLKHLSFSIRQSADDIISPNTIIDLLKTPFLQSIMITLPSTDNDSPLPSITRLVMRSKCQLLTHVTVHGPHLDEEEIIYFLGESQPVLRVVN